MHILSRICCKLFQNRDRTALVQCRECGAHLKVFVGPANALSSVIAVGHACFHLDQPIFACRHCDYRSKARSVMQQHIRRAHNLSSNGRFIGTMANYLNEIKGKLLRCFDENGHAAQQEIYRKGPEEDRM